MVQITFILLYLQHKVKSKNFSNTFSHDQCYFSKKYIKTKLLGGSIQFFE